MFFLLINTFFITFLSGSILLGEGMYLSGSGLLSISALFGVGIYQSYRRRLRKKKKRHGVKSDGACGDVISDDSDYGDSDFGGGFSDSGGGFSDSGSGGGD